MYSKNAWTISLFSILSFAFFYRIVLYYQLYHPQANQTPPLGYLPEYTSKLLLVGTLASDVKSTFFLLLAVGLLLLSCRIAIPSRLRVLRRIVSAAIAGAALVLVTVVYVLHQSMLWALGSGADYGIILYSIRTAHLVSFSTLTTATDWILIAGMASIALLYWRAPPRVQLVFRIGILSISAIAIPCKLYFDNSHKDQMHIVDGTGVVSLGHGEIPREIAISPVTFLLYSFTRSRGEFDAEAEALSSQESLSPRFVESFSTGNTRPAELTLPNTNTQRFNVVLIQMESVSFKYALSDGEADLKFMPFLESLIPQSVVFDRHYSSGVDTDHGVFGLFTGLFPVTQPIQFDEREDLRLPTMFSFLSSTYHSFFVTGSDLRVWYPEPLLKNTGLQQVVDSSNSTALAHGALEFKTRDESGTGDIFSEMIQKTAEPFLGVYYPYSTHWPYTIYDSSGSEVPKLNKLERYSYNLHIVDNQIKKVFEALSKRGILDRTIVIITADHGEAFGEHGAWGHGVALFDINTYIPMVIFQPRVFTPRHVNAFTSHVDILPTLLDALGVNYDPAQFAGESLFRPRKRPYTFFYAPKTDLLGSIDANGQKLVVDFAKDECWTVNLVTDAGETSPAQCDPHSAQLAALLVFRRYNVEMLSNLATEDTVVNNSK